MHYDYRGDEEHCIFDNPRDLDAVEILHAEQWKPGIMQLYVRHPKLNPCQFTIAYCATGLFENREAKCH